MARDEVVEIAVRARIDHLRAELAKIPGVTEKEAKGMVRELEKQLRKAEQSARKGGQAFDKLGKQTEGLKKASMAAGGQLGAMGGMLDDAVEAALLLGGPGAALGLVAAGLGITAALTAAYTKAIVGLVEAAGEAVEKQRELGLVTEQEAKIITEANAALDAMDVAYDALTVTLAQAFAPAVKDVAVLVTAAGLAVNDALKGMVERGEILKRSFVALAQMVGGPVAGAMATFVAESFEFAGGMDLIGGATGDYLSKAENLVGNLQVQRDELKKTREEAEKLAKAYAAAAAKNEDSNREAFMAVRQLYIDNRDAAIESTAEITAAANDATEERKTKAQEAYAAMTDAAAKHHQAQLDMLEEEAEKRKAVFAMAIEGADQLFGYASTIAQNIAESVTEGMDEESEARKKAMRTAWKIDKATRLGQVALATAVNAVALAAPPPLGLGPIAGPVFALAAGAGAIAAIATEPTPKFHTGRAPDEIPATLTRSEGVANDRAMSTPGFPEALAAANAGAPTGGGWASTTVVLNDRVLDTIVTRALTQQGARLAVQRTALSPSGLGRGAYR